MSLKIAIQCIVLDDKYENDDYQVLIKLIIKKPDLHEFYAWNGLEWRNENGLVRVYDNHYNQFEYDEFTERLKELEKSKLLYEIAEDLEEDQSYYIEQSRMYIYIESKKEIE